jgi:prophage tail gpP-like protein
MKEVAKKPKADDLTLTIGGKKMSGWTTIEVSCSAEALPRQFVVGMSTQDPITGLGTAVRPGDDCTVSLGEDVVVTGYVDRVVNAGGAQSHELHVVGRGKCADLVDCSAEWEENQIINGDLASISKKLCTPYGITVELKDGANAGPPIPQFNLNLGDTVVSIIERLARNAGVLFYEDAAGQLVFALVGTERATSGAAYGANVESWTAVESMDQRYSEVECTLMSMDGFADVAGDPWAFFTAPDPNVKRHRKLNIVADQSSQGQELVKRRAIWEVARRAGRGREIQVTVDSWRDSAGKLWEPNTIVPVEVPGLSESTDLVLGAVSYRRDDRSGTTADLLLMPPDAFRPEPIVLQPDAVAEAIPEPVTP